MIMTKKIFVLAVFVMSGFCAAQAATIHPENSQTPAAQQEKYAEIKFDTLTYNFGQFSEADPVVRCSFAFTNTGDAPLIIHQAIASCGCTVPTYTKDPIRPGERGQVDVTYNGQGKFPGHFRKTITVRTNAKENSTVRLFIEGEMLAVEEKK